MIDLAGICWKLKLRLLGGWGKSGLVYLVMSVYPFITVEVWIQYLGLQALVEWIWKSSTSIIHIYEESHLVWSWLGFQITFKEPYKTLQAVGPSMLGDNEKNQMLT
jgi:hypothetical protein